MSMVVLCPIHTWIKLIIYSVQALDITVQLENLVGN